MFSACRTEEQKKNRQQFFIKPKNTRSNIDQTNGVQFLLLGICISLYNNHDNTVYLASDLHLYGKSQYTNTKNNNNKKDSMMYQMPSDCVSTLLENAP